VRPSDFDFDLPAELIAQHPPPLRDQSRLLALDRKSGRISHAHFTDLLNYLRGGDLLVLNDSKVIPARLRGVNLRTGGKFELLLLRENGVNDFWAMIKPGKRARIETQMELQGRGGELTGIRATVIIKSEEGHACVKFSGTPDIQLELERLGEVPLPPYIERSEQLPKDRERYQTVYARARGSVAAPTAGLHFTTELLDHIKAKGGGICYVTLHVGLGTFAPVKAERLEDHVMHEERYDIPAETAKTITAAKRAGQRVIAVGTTTLRVLESAASESGQPAPASGSTRIFIYPPFQFRVVDALLTNFHLPRSTLLMLASAFAAPGETRGRDIILNAYREAVRERYRFFSYGDAMLIS
jgi:S-adenosylmethionine:tRNA ribosyltransferase-isomerase